MNSKKSVQRRTSLKSELEVFLHTLPGQPSLKNVGPVEVRQFLIYKDRSGRTVVHDQFCPLLGTYKKESCECRVGLTSMSLSNLISSLKVLFEQEGRGTSWNMQFRGGNPAASPLVLSYLKFIKETQAKAHVLPKQARPLFFSKVKLIMQYFRGLILSTYEVGAAYALYRDCALFSMQFFAGDRADDVARVLIQEVRVLDGGQFVSVHHTFGKTWRGQGSGSNFFVLSELPQCIACPVRALRAFVAFAVGSGLQMEVGPLFREVSSRGSILPTHVTYSSIYKSLKQALDAVGQYEGETPHSVRSGLAVSALYSYKPVDPVDLAAHVGWRSLNSLGYYARADQFKEAFRVSQRVGQAVQYGGQSQDIYNRFVRQ